MGLTIHYTLKSNLDDPRQVVEQMRELALDLPFEEVGEVVDLEGDQCDWQNGEEKDENLRWLLIQAGQSVTCPWNKHTSRRVPPTRVIAFSTWPGPGSEGANFGLCLYPAEIEWKYEWTDDIRFHETPRNGIGVFNVFSSRKWERYRKHNPGTPHIEIRQVPTKLTGWSWSSFCKTQYASDPKCGGIPNFLRCHISVITLLDRMAKLPGLKVTVDDEGHYGAHMHSDDWEEATKAGRKPHYYRRKGKYSPAALAQEVGEWNTMIAGFAGALSDALRSTGMALEAPIKEFANFEQLEFKGQNQKYLAPFLEAMKALSKNERS